VRIYTSRDSTCQGPCDLRPEESSFNLRHVSNVATYGSRLRAAREAHGLTQDQLAAALGTNRFTVIRWEKDQALPESYDAAIAKFFDDESFILPPRDRESQLAVMLEEVRSLSADVQSALGRLGDLESRLDALESRLGPSGQ